MRYTALCLFVFLSGSAFAQQAIPVWQPHVDVEAKPGSKRNIGEADFFLPMWQDGRAMLFGNARLRVADHDSREGNLGLGYRRMLEGGWNLGGYGYYDRRRSTSGNYFNQATFGAEALGRDFDFRGNVYLPQGDRVRDLGSATVGGGTTAAIVGTTVQVTTAGSTTFLNQELALKGYDLEAGWRAPVWAAEADRQLRLYAGGYHFSDGGVRVSGPRVRAELTMAEIPSLWKGAQLVLGAEYQDDNARGGQGFVSARLRIPLGSEKNVGYKMNWQERRMAAPIVRDVDVVTQARATPIASTPTVVETATQTAGGTTFSVINGADFAGTDLTAQLAAAGAGSTVILSGTFNTTATSTLQAGQTLTAGTFTVRTPSGRTAVLTSPATINSTDNTLGNGAITMASNSTVSGLTVNRSSVVSANVINADGASGITIANNTLTSTSNGSGGNARGIRIANGSNATVTGNTVTASRTGTGGTEGLFLSAVSNVTVSGNTFVSNAAGVTSGIQALGNNTGITITGNTIQTGLGTAESYGISFVSVGATNSGIIISGNSVSVTDSVFAGTIVVGGGNTLNATISGNTLTASGGGVMNAVRVGNGTINANAGSTGNVRVSGTCTLSGVGAINGTIGFTDGTPCP